MAVPLSENYGLSNVNKMTWKRRESKIFFIEICSFLNVITLSLYIYIGIYIYMPWKLWGLFCTAAVVHKLFWLYYECKWMKGKIRKHIRNVDNFGVYTGKKLLQTTINLRQWIQTKAYSQPVKNIWISSLILILIFWWIELTVWETTEKFTKILSLILKILKIFGKENLHFTWP